MIRPGAPRRARALGFVRVPVYPRARVGVISTGDELVEGGGPLAPGQIRESNRDDAPRAGRAGRLRPRRPRPRATTTRTRSPRSSVEARQDCDALVSSGGVSMGDFDLVKVVLDRIGDMRWMQIAIRPAKPFAFGLVGSKRTPVFGLPGNPVSSLVSFELFARPALRQMMGHAAPRPASAHRCRRRRPPPPARRQDALHPGDRPLRPRRPVPRSPRPGPRARTSSPRRPQPTRWSRCPTATASRAGLTSMPCCCSDSLLIVTWPHSLSRRPPISSTPTDARSATCASRSPTAATSAARTACRRRGCSGCPAPSC